MSRLARLRQDRGEEYQPDMPPLTGLEYLLGLFWDIGPAMSGAMGSGPLTHGEIESAQRNLRIMLSPWDCRVLRRLSIEYLNEMQRAEKLGCEPPWKTPDMKPEPTATQMSLRALVNL